MADAVAIDGHGAGSAVSSQAPFSTSTESPKAYSGGPRWKP
jgi:hypothetical protein